MTRVTSGLTLDQGVAKVTRENPAFALGTADIRGSRYTVFKNVPDHCYAMLVANRAAHGGGAWDYLIFEDQRWSFDDFLGDVHRMAMSCIISTASAKARAWRSRCAIARRC